jgi:hypothetical protein
MVLWDAENRVDAEGEFGTYLVPIWKDQPRDLIRVGRQAGCQLEKIVSSLAI